jgi:uncharacterized protein (DUF2147 family)
MQKLFIAACLVLLVAFQVKGQEPIEGIWLTEEGTSKVEIYQNGDQYFGKIVWMDQSMAKGGNPVDKNNPDKNLRNRPLMGMDMLYNLQKRNGKWYGKLYAPMRGITLDVVIERQVATKLVVNISYLGFSRQQIWTSATLKAIKH